VEVLLKMQHCDVSCAKQACVLYIKEIHDIVLGLDSDDDKYYTSQESGDEEEPCPPSRRSSISQPPSPDYSASSSEDEDGLAMWQVNSHNHFSGHCPLNPEGVECMPLLGAPLSRRDAGTGCE